MLQVQSRRTPGDSHTNPTPPANHLLITHSSMCDDRAIVITLRVQIWASSLRPLSCLSAWRACVCTPYLPPECVFVCVCGIYAFLDAHLRHPALGRALSHPTGKPLGNGGFGKASGNVCAKLSDGFVSITAAFGPGAVTEDQNREFLQRSSRFQCRESPANPLLK